MANISAAMVKELRERTGLGMMECKKALVESEGDIEKAIDDLRKSSGMKAAKKAGRTAADGVVALRVADDNSYAVLLEVNSETDFVARDENFLGFVNKVLDKAFADKQTDVAALMAGELESAREALVQKSVKISLCVVCSWLKVPWLMVMCTARTVWLLLWRLAVPVLTWHVMLPCTLPLLTRVLPSLMICLRKSWRVRKRSSWRSRIWMVSHRKSKKKWRWAGLRSSSLKIVWLSRRSSRTQSRLLVNWLKRPVLR